MTHSAASRIRVTCSCDSDTVRVEPEGAFHPARAVKHGGRLRSSALNGPGPTQSVSRAATATVATVTTAATVAAASAGQVRAAAGPRCGPAGRTQPRSSNALAACDALLPRPDDQPRFAPIRPTLPGSRNGRRRPSRLPCRSRVRLHRPVPVPPGARVRPAGGPRSG